MQTLQTQIRLFLNEQSEQGLHCLPFHLEFLRNNCINSKIKAKIIWNKVFEIVGHLPYHPIILLADSRGPDQTLQMHRLIWAFAVCICPKTRFCMAPPTFKSEYLQFISQVRQGIICCLMFEMQDKNFLLG